MNQPWLRAGLIGAGMMVVINLLGLIPALGLVSLPLQPVALAGVGALAASFMLPRREAGRGAGQGALAGVLAGLAGGIVLVITTAVGFNVMGGADAVISQLPPAVLDQYTQMGLDPRTILSSGVITGFATACCLPTNLIVGALLGALGGGIFAAAKPE